MSQIARITRVGAQILAQGVGGSSRTLPLQRRLKTYYRSGAIKPMPSVMPFGLGAFLATVIPGLFIGATISKNIANFLEENELFVPSDDDDDED